MLPTVWTTYLCKMSDVEMIKWLNVEGNVFGDDDSNMDYVQNDKKIRIVIVFLFNILTYESTNVNNIQLFNRSADSTVKTKLTDYVVGRYNLIGLVLVLLLTAIRAAIYRSEKYNTWWSDSMLRQSRSSLATSWVLRHFSLLRLPDRCWWFSAEFGPRPTTAPRPSFGTRSTVATVLLLPLRPFHEPVKGKKSFWQLQHLS